MTDKKKLKWIVYMSQDGKWWGLTREDMPITVVTPEQIVYAKVMSNYNQALKLLLRKLEARENE